jgi:hypothetical protein
MDLKASPLREQHQPTCSNPAHLITRAPLARGCDQYSSALKDVHENVIVTLYKRVKSDALLLKDRTAADAKIIGHVLTAAQADAKLAIHQAGVCTDRNADSNSP